MSTLLLAAADPSKLPFYLAGFALAAWAVVLALVGLRNPTFPDSARGARGVMLFTFLLVAVTVAMAIVTA